MDAKAFIFVDDSKRFFEFFLGKGLHAYKQSATFTNPPTHQAFSSHED